ncbi:diguanylate cyclase [Thermodesulfovibrionales bacterium]|nr:diguanylate cyclase [Thermodesulfovibrionales bacterium]
MKNDLIEEERKVPERIKILVVDDEEVIRNLLADVLTDDGYKVIAAASAEEALEKIKETPFEVIITDLMLPGINGLEVLRKIKKMNFDISVIVITGYATVETAVKAIKEGAYDYISKPFDTAEIKIVVGRAIERQVLIRGVKEKEHYKKLSITDGLTQIYSHRYFHELLYREIMRARRYFHPLSLLMIDIDDFKSYNDAHGHLVGDKLLKMVAAVLSREVREVDSVARYGGEEFGIILPEMDKKGASLLTQRLRGAIEKTKVDGEEIMPSGCLTISIGVSSYPDDAASREELIQRADEALYEANHLGENRVCLFKGGGVNRWQF